MAISKTSNKTSQGTKIDFMKAVNNLGQPLAAVAGFAVGKYALKKLEKSQAVSGLMGPEMKGYIVPAAITMGGLIVGTQFTKNPYLQIGMIGVAGAGVESMVKKATGKTMLAGLEGLMGEEESYENEMAALPAYTQELPAADIDIEREIQRSINGAEDFSMSDEPVGGAEDFSMSDEPVGNASDFSMSDEPVGKVKQPSYIEDEDEDIEGVGLSSIGDEKINEDADLFAGDMMPD